MLLKLLSLRRSFYICLFIYLFIYLFILLLEFFTLVLTDCLSLELVKTSLVDLNNAAVWMVSIRSLIFRSSGPCTNHLVTVPRAPITICISITFMFHSFPILKRGPGTYTSFQFLSNFLSDQAAQQNPQFSEFSFPPLI